MLITVVHILLMITGLRPLHEATVTEIVWCWRHLMVVLGNTLEVNVNG